ncbi:MAG: VWA domain-containing protein, partial [Clostridia bacterium]|nr:VWA domain-containing protein [Clostridia bacterium]
MKKRILSFVLALVLLLGLVAALPAEKAAAESLYIRKIVSVVYDDSGSMSGSGVDKWSYASYAMQTFAGLMNNDDRLFVTFMSDVDNGVENPTRELDVTNTAIQNTVDGIRNHAEAGNTPYAAVAYAWNTLLQVQDDDPNTQYWLVVLTDGSMGVKEDDMGRDFRSITSTTMPNGSNPQVTFVAIGDGAIAPKNDPENSIYVYKAAKSDKIVDTMAEMADRVSGRRRLDKEVKKAGSNALKFTTEVPLLNVAVLCQNSAASLESVSGPDGSLTISRTVSMKYPEANGWKTAKKLVGSAFVASGTGNLPAGEYVLTFADDIKPKDVVVMIEPALEIRIVVTRGGVELTPEEFQNLAAGETVDVKATIYESGTDKEVDPSLLPEDTNFTVKVKENGSETLKTEDGAMLLEGVTLNQVPTEFWVQVQ